MDVTEVRTAAQALAVLLDAPDATPNEAKTWMVTRRPRAVHISEPRYCVAGSEWMGGNPLEAFSEALMVAAEFVPPPENVPVSLGRPYAPLGGLMVSYGVSVGGSLGLTLHRVSNVPTTPRVFTNDMAVMGTLLEPYRRASKALLVGSVTYIIDNWAFPVVPDQAKRIEAAKEDGDLNILPGAFPVLMAEANQEAFLSELKMFLSEPFALGYKNSFFRKVARPIATAGQAVANKRWDEAEECLSNCEAKDWQRAVRRYVALVKEATEGQASEAVR